MFERHFELVPVKGTVQLRAYIFSQFNNIQIFPKIGQHSLFNIHSFRIFGLCLSPQLRKIIIIIRVKRFAKQRGGCGRVLSYQSIESTKDWKSERSNSIFVSISSSWANINFTRASLRTIHSIRSIPRSRGRLGTGSNSISPNLTEIPCSGRGSKIMFF